MPVYQLLIIILIVFLIVALVIGILTSPITWIIIGALFIASSIRRYLYRKQLEEYNEQFKKKAQEKKEYYYQERRQQSSQDDDVIDVDYTVHEDE